MGRVTGTLGVSGKLSKTRCWNDWGMGLMMEGGGLMRRRIWGWIFRNSINEGFVMRTIYLGR